LEWVPRLLELTAGRRRILAGKVAIVLTLALGAPAQAGNSPHVAVDADGNANFVWQIDDATDSLIQERSEDATFLLSDPQWVSAAGRSALEAQVAVDGGGNAIIVWPRFNGSHYVIQTRRRATDSELGPIQTLSTVGQSAFDPQVSVRPGGNAMFTWQRVNGTNNVIEGRRRAADGTLSAVQTISQTGQNASQPQVALDPNGHAIFTWRRFDGAHYVIQTRRRSSGGSLSAVQDLSDPAQDAHEPQLAIDPSGNAFFTWRRFNGAEHRVQCRRRAEDGTLSAVQSLSSAGQEADEQQVVVDGSSRAIFAWRRGDGSNWIVQARRRAADGTLSGVQNLSVAGQNAGHPQLAVDPNGNAVFVWDRSDGLNLIVQARARAADGTLSAVQSLSAAGKDATLPDVGMDPDGGHSVFTWQRLNGANDLIVQMRRREADGDMNAVRDLSE
jgi:hypothetical protein